MSTGPRIVCVLCGRTDYADRMIYSSHTGNHGCVDYKACERRAARNKKALEKAAA